MPTLLRNIPTNVITGFLGVGKTTAILELLKHKPAGETWAVLVNEFGKIGIDGQLLKQDGVEIKEIPGGCMCCAAGVSMQVGLNALVARARPDRLLVEPTGIGHPKQIIKQLTQPPFDQLLDMRASICLVDPRHLNDERYVSNEYYQEQLQIADVLVANKADEATIKDKTAFELLVKERGVSTSGWVEYGQLDPAWLDLPHRTQHGKSFVALGMPAKAHDEIDTIHLDESERFRRMENHDKEYYSCGWLFADDIVFSYTDITAILQRLKAERIKATLKTDKGSYSFNGVSGKMSVSKKYGSIENRLELISLFGLDWQVIEEGVLSAMLPKT